VTRALLTLLLLALAGGGCSTQLAAQGPTLPVQARSEPGHFLVVTVRNDSQTALARAGSTPRAYAGTNNYGVRGVAAEVVRALEHDYGLRQVSAWPIATLKVHCVMFRLPGTGSAGALIARLTRDPRVDSVEPLNEFSTEGAPEPNGAQEWMPYNDPYGPLQSSLRELGVIPAQRHTRGAGVRIAIIDTGVDFKHPDLAGRIIAHRNFVDRDEATFRADLHGTAVAGVIAADADNGIGIVGIAPQSQIIALKSCWQVARGDARAVCNSFTLAEGLQAAILAHADIVNLSLAGPPDPLLARLIAAGARQGIVFVGAAAPASSSGPVFPADLDPVLPVQTAEARSPRSTYLSAPGRDILSLAPGGHYDFSSGSSLAAAEVTGIVALILSDRPHLAAGEIRARLERSVAFTNQPSGEIRSVNACAALAFEVPAEHCTPIGAVGRVQATSSPASR
jgi:subtilisin family serine protease